LRLLLLYPEVAARSCEDCQKWWYDDLQADGTVKFTSKLVGIERVEQAAKSQPEKRSEFMEQVCRRPANTPTPCDKCPKVSPSEARKHVLSSKNEQAYRFYRQSKAMNFANFTNRMKRDETLARNCQIIADVERTVERRDSMTLLGAMFGGKA
jgi:hypothetical protein